MTDDLHKVKDPGLHEYHEAAPKTHSAGHSRAGLFRIPVIPGQDIREVVIVDDGILPYAVA